MYSFHLFLNEGPGYGLPNLSVDKRGVQEKKRDLEGAGLDFIPFDDGPADIVAADQKVGSGQFAQRPLAA